jgi:hypothetical protein
VENTGYEITLNTVNIRKTNFDWNTSFNITIPENKLLKFPGLASSSYASKFIIGKPLSLVYIARYMGVDPQTGLASVDDINKNGTFQVTNLNGDLYAAFDQDPKVYGGIQNDLRYKNFRLNIFLQFNQQYTQNWRSIFSTTSPGGIINVPTQVLDRWQQPGDVTNVQKFTTITPSSTSLTGNSAAYYSDARYTNAFYMRLKTVMLSYTLPAGVIKKMRMTGANVFMQGQNLFTFSPFSATDPETAFITRLSPLTTITAGLQLNF